MEIRPIAYIRSDYDEKFGIPKQCGLVPELEQAIIIEPEFRNIDALREIESFNYLWVIWGFSANKITGSKESWSPTVRPPRLGGERRVGVWASRSPYRPNSLGLSSVRFERLELDGKIIHTDELSGMVNGELAIIVSGADMMNGTPVFDIKPYLPFSDCHPDAGSGYSSRAEDPCLEVEVPKDKLEKIDESARDGLLRVLSLDPRDAYNKKDGCTYGMSFAGHNIRFVVSGNKLTVTDIS